MQKRGVPTVSIVDEVFVSLAKSYAASHGSPDLPMVVVPHPFETRTREEIRAIADKAFPQILAQVTKSAKPKPAAGS